MNYKIWKYENMKYETMKIHMQGSRSQRWCGTTGQWSLSPQTTLSPSPLDAGTSSHSWGWKSHCFENYNYFLTKFTKCWPPSPSCMKSYFFSGQFWIIEISKVSSWPVTKLKMKPFDIVILIFNVAGLVSARYQARTLLVLPALTWDLAWQTLQS